MSLISFQLLSQKVDSVTIGSSTTIKIVVSYNCSQYNNRFKAKNRISSFDIDRYLLFDKGFFQCSASLSMFLKSSKVMNKLISMLTSYRYLSCNLILGYLVSQKHFRRIPSEHFIKTTLLQS